MDVQTFLRDPGNLALRLPADELFGVLSRRIELPPSFAALIVRDDRTTSLATHGVIEARGVIEVVLIRSTSIPLSFQPAGLVSQDGIECGVTLGVCAQVVTERSDLEAFAKTILGGSRRADVRRLVLYMQDAINRVLHDYVRARPAEMLVQPHHDVSLDHDLVAALEPLTFAAGLSILRPMTIQIVSPAFEVDRRAKREGQVRQQRLEEQNRLRQAADDARRKHVEELSGLLDRLDGMARQRPGVAVTELIRTFNVTDRGELYRQLLTRQVSARATRAIAVVAGAELLMFEARDGSLLARREFNASLGAMRSVRLTHHDGQEAFLLGAARGVYHYVPQTDAVTSYSFEPPGRLRGGVNSAVVLNGRLYATHSEVGVLSWALDAPDRGEVILREHTQGSTAIRDIQSSKDSILWLTSGERVIGWSPQTAADIHSATIPSVVSTDTHAPMGPAHMQGNTSLPQPATRDETQGHGTLVSLGSIAGAGRAPQVAALCVAEGTVYAGTSDGRLLAWPCTAPSSFEVILAGEGGPIDSVQWMSGAGIERLLVACRRPYVWLIVRGDVVRSEYRADEPVRWAAAADDWLIASNDRRDRLFIWRPWQPQAVDRTIPVARLTGHSIQDAVLIPA